MTPTELVKNLAAGRLSLADARVLIHGMRWRVPPLPDYSDPDNPVSPTRIGDAWNPADSADELMSAAESAGLDPDTREALASAYMEAPNKLRLTIEQLESGEGDPASEWSAAAEPAAEGEPDDEEPEEAPEDDGEEAEEPE